MTRNRQRSREALRAAMRSCCYAPANTLIALAMRGGTNAADLVRQALTLLVCDDEATGGCLHQKTRRLLHRALAELSNPVVTQ